MDLIRTILFESPWYLVPLLLLGEFILLRRWATRRTPAARRAVLGGLAVAVVLVMVQSLVVTERETLIRICKDLAIAAEDGNVAGIGEHVSDRFQTQSLNRDAFMEWVRRGLTAVEVKSARLSGFDVDIPNGRRATVIFNASSRVYGAAEGLGGTRPSRWELHFEKIGGRWLIVFLTPRPGPFFPFDSLGGLLRGVGG